jgi:protease-4
MKIRILSVALLAMTIACMVQAQGLSNYYSRNDFLTAPPASFHDGLVGFANPANLALLKSVENRFFWSTDGVDAWSFKDWGYFFGVPHLGFGIQHQKFGDYAVTDFRLSTAFGSPAYTVGFAYTWSKGDRDYMGREKLLSVGTIMRPFKCLSLGLVGDISLESDWSEGVAEIGVRPLGTSRLTLFADGVLEKRMKVEDIPWSAGAAVEVMPGIDLVGRYFESEAFTVGLAVNLGLGGIGAQTHYDSEQNHSYYTYHVRVGGMRPSIFPPLIAKDKMYVAFNLKGRVDYQRYVWFDDATLRFMDIINNIRAAARDPRVAVIALNLSSMRVSPEHAWEIRQELQETRDSGKQVIVFIDNADMTIYHLASVADRIVMDPQGSLGLFGIVLGRTFFKETLEKLGLGFDEWRFFEYKSAAEVLSRDKMSEADRRQRQDYIDDWYETLRLEICRSRSFSEKVFDSLVDNEAYFMSDVALQSGLVDTLARWSEKGKIVNRLAGRNLRGISSRQLMSNALPPSVWGERSKIAVVYGLGTCAMDSGIKARWLEGVFLRIKNDESIRAVVFRVDSPGGDAMASDLVAEALRKCARQKPVIVSQGQVAGSGGYGISLYGDTIVAGPYTVTGSIGVIGGWIYDKGISDKLGMTSDLVKRGEHADLGYGVTLPFLNLRIPARNLSDEERTKVEDWMRKFYDIFVKKVADGRDMPVEEVRKIAEGHFYSGLDGKDIGLVDEIGGLMTALTIAREKAGLALDEDIEIVEIPKYKGWFRFRPPSMNPFGMISENDPVYEYIRMNIEHKGKPLPMMVPGAYPTSD